ncbi:MAG: type 1 glutamine amidotransferase [Bacteroidia bacterium]|jgi:type 1 glutamine amidotransferase
MIKARPFWKTLLIWLGGLLGLLVSFALFMIWYWGIWNAIVPSDSNDTEPPIVPVGLQRPAVLVFSKTNGFRHVDGIADANRFFEALAKRRGWGLYQTENGAVFTSELLARFDAVVFNSSTGDMLSRAQETAFEQWLEGGGGWLGIHAAGDGSQKDWEWYQDNLIGAKFTAHIVGPGFQAATINVDDSAHPAMGRLPARWSHKEEWYSWASSPRTKNFRILATVDESTYSPESHFLGTFTDLRMGDHPIVWSNCVGQGRSLYSAMGHKGEVFDEAEIQTLMEDALSWVLGLSGELCGE